MGATAMLRDPLLPRQPGGMAGGAALAIGVHAVLVVALAAAVNWRTQAVDVIASAELWAAVPQSAAPPPAAQPPSPPPAPVAAPPAPAVVAPEVPRIKPEIAIERERDRARDKARTEREEREAAAAKAKAATAAEAAKTKAAEAAKAAAAAAADEAKLAAQRAENLRRMMGQAGSGPATSTGSAARDAAPSGAYIGRLVATIRTNIVFTASPPGNPTAEVEVRAGPSGTILSRRLVKPSGVAEWDDAVLRAIDRTAALPRDTDGRVPPVLLIAFRLRE